MKNILSADPSPYLQQHKNNPVHWQTWNKDTLNLAKKQKIKPRKSEADSVKIRRKQTTK